MDRFNFDLPEPLNDVQFTKRCSDLLEKFHFDVQQTLKMFILRNLNERIEDNIGIAINMAIEWSDIQQQHLPFQPLSNDDPLILEANLDPPESSSDFHDEFQTIEMEWIEKTTEEEKQFFLGDVEMAEDSLLELVRIKRTHNRWVLSCDLKSVLEEFKDYVSHFI